MPRGTKPRSNAYRGVRLEQGRFRAYVVVAGRSLLLGAYDDPRTAAIARDRAVLSLGLDTPLNLPRRSKQLGPCSPEELRRQARLAAKKNGSSRFFGVVPNPYTDGWDASVTVDRKRRYIARYLNEEDAARAHDRAALELLGLGARLNFPTERLKPASIETLRKEAAALLPVRGMSPLHGVRKAPRAGSLCWVSTITVDYDAVYLGAWRTEREAALAHDRAALHIPGPRLKLNFPAAARKLGAATPKMLRAEACRSFKQTTTSRYRGVSWNAKDQVWRAAIGHRGRQFRLGSFHDEEQAADAYDEAARRLHKRRAKLNFPT